VGINGSPAASIAPLQINSNINQRALSLLENTGGESWQLGVQADGDLLFEDSGGGAKVTFQDVTGNGGNGTTAPANNLHVKGTTGIAVSSAPLAGLSMVFRGMEAKANINATDPVAAGELWLCTDCTAPYSLCVSTGTAVADYAKMGTTDGCN
jgi:hypothetical protein